MAYRRPQIDRFNEKFVVDVNGCWLWQASTDKDGYGVFYEGGRRGRSLRAHRWIYEHLVGPIGTGLVIDHLCRNTLCVNPRHLEPVTMKVNLLRGNGLTSRHARATHCPQGHPYDLLNTYNTPDGKRVCRLCNAEKNRRYQRSRKELTHAS